MEGVRETLVLQGSRELGDTRKKNKSRQRKRERALYRYRGGRHGAIEGALKPIYL